MTTSLITAPPVPRLGVAPAAPRTTAVAGGPVCAGLPQVFQHPLLEEPPTGAAHPADRRAYASLLATAAAACRSCPLVAACLYRAVVEHDVAGFVAGTTARQRAEIRRRLGVTVRPEDLDTVAGVVGSRQVDHDEVVRLRAAHPDESLEVLAGRLGCSLSTVKRHLRRERTEPRATAATRKPGPGQVLAAAASVTGSSATSSRAA